MAEEKKQKIWKVALNGITFFALALLVFLTRHDILETINRIDDINWIILILMIPMQGLNFYAYALMYDDLLRIVGSKVSRLNLFRITLELNFVNHVFPSGGVSGFSFFSIRLKPFKVTTGKSTFIQMMRFILVFVSFQIVLGFGVTALAFSGAVNNFVLLTAGSIFTLLVASTLLLAYVIGSKQRINMFFTGITKLINSIIRFIRPKHKEAINISKAQNSFTELHENYLLIRKDMGVLKSPLWHSFVANITEVVTLYMVFVAFGFWVNPGAVILAYAVANFAGLISILPGGVGVYEALMTAVLTSAGVPAGVSFPVVVMYRVSTMVMQLLPGYVLYHKSVQGDKINL